MELRICCEQKIELEKYKNLKSINYEIDRYTFDNGELNGNVPCDCFKDFLYDIISLLPPLDR